MFLLSSLVHGLVLNEKGKVSFQSIVQFDHGGSSCSMLEVVLDRGSEWGGPLVGCRLKFSYFVGSQLKFSIFVGSGLNFLIFVGCWKISVRK